MDKKYVHRLVMCKNTNCYRRELNCSLESVQHQTKKSRQEQLLHSRSEQLYMHVRNSISHIKVLCSGFIRNLYHYLYRH